VLGLTLTVFVSIATFLFIESSAKSSTHLAGDWSRNPMMTDHPPAPLAALWRGLLLYDGCVALSSTPRAS